MLIDIGDYGEVEAVATAYTLVIYEQEFGGRDLISDVFGKHDGKDEGDEKPDGDEPDAGGRIVVDFTSDNWLSELRAVWAMVRTAYDIAYDRGDAAPNARPKPFKEWVKGVGKLDMRKLSLALITECMDGFFHTGAAASA